MTDFLARFGLVDFLAYLFPGIMSLSAMWTLLAIVHRAPALPPIDIPIAFLFIVVSYVISIILAAPCESLRKVFCAAFHTQGVNSRDDLSRVELKAEIEGALHRVFGSSVTTTASDKKRFHLVRAVVTAKCPRLAEEAARQNVLFTFRQYLYAPVLLWTAAGVTWVVTLRLGTITNVVLLAAVFLVATGVLRSLTVRLAKNRQREVRILCNAFLVVEQSGALQANSANQGAREEAT